MAHDHGGRAAAAEDAPLPCDRADGCWDDNVDIAAAGDLGIPVCNIPDYGTEEVADTALALILGLFRGTLATSARLAAGDAVQGADAIAACAGASVRRVRGATLGLVGLGRIGTATAVRAKAFGFDVVFYDPYRDDGADKALGIRRAASLGELAAESTCLSLHCNCDASTAGLVDAALLAQLPPGALLVNTARGELVDETALAAALGSGHLAAVAALDVHASEPFRAGEGALAGAPNLHCTPHLGWYSPEARLEMRQKGAAAARRACEGRELRNIVNAQHLRLRTFVDVHGREYSPSAARRR